jgi:hypothetical protein
MAGNCCDLSGSSTYRERPTCTERKSLNKRVRMEGWRQRRLGSKAKTSYREEKEKLPEKEKPT